MDVLNLGANFITVLSVGDVLLWAVLAAYAKGLRRHHGRSPDGVVAGTIVATGSAAVGGLVTSLGWLNWLSLDITEMAAAAWRMSMLIALLYAGGVAWRVARRAK